MSLENSGCGDGWRDLQRNINIIDILLLLFFFFLSCYNVKHCTISLIIGYATLIVLFFNQYNTTNFIDAILFFMQSYSTQYIQLLQLQFVFIVGGFNKDGGGICSPNLLHTSVARCWCGVTMGRAQGSEPRVSPVFIYLNIDLKSSDILLLVALP